MVLLSTEQKSSVRSILTSELSAARAEIPITKSQLDSLLTIIDDSAETDEANIVSAIPASPGKDWLLANPDVSRRIREATATKRKEVL